MIDVQDAAIESRTAVFIDAENMCGWILQEGVDRLLRELTAIGPQIVRRAYGRWDQRELVGA